ncbi:hypothetical protein ACWD5R_21825 [Streptomyces sp. NPDC002514]|uniref:hypothetical protein n=1 Tax=Streptomyces sp. NPDC001270 TaxID=3364554 RepID=UPI0036C516EB
MRLVNALRSGNGTGPRFALLLALVVAASATTLDVVLSSIRDLGTDSSATPLKGTFGCLLAAGVDPSSADVDTINAVIGRMKLFDQCVGEQPTSYGGVIGTLVLFAVAAATYWLLPVWRDRRHRLVPVEAVDADGTLRAELATLSVPALLLTAVTSPKVTVGTGADEYMQSRVQPARQPPARAPEQQARMRSWQAWAWMYHGGTERFEQIRHALEQLNKLLGEGQQRGVQPDWAGYRRTCAALDSTVENTEQYFPVPLADLQKEWESALLTMRQGARRCVTTAGAPAAGQNSPGERGQIALTLSVQQIATGAVAWQKATVHIGDVAGGSELPAP